MTSTQPLVMYNGISTNEIGLSASHYDLVKRLYADHRSDFLRHKTMLSAVSSDISSQPLLFIKTSPNRRPVEGSSLGANVDAVNNKYAHLANQISDLEAEDQVEQGALRTAAAVVKQLSKAALAPPELTWMGHEAIVMLWVLGATKYALTITEGEVGYVVRADGKTIRRDHSIALEDFDLLRLS